MTERDHVAIPRLEEYYRAGRVCGWGENVPPEFRAATKFSPPTKQP